jgi:hypothetical protein
MYLAHSGIAAVALLVLAITCCVVCLCRRGWCPRWLRMLGLVAPLVIAAESIWAVTAHEDGESIGALGGWMLLAAALLLLGVLKPRADRWLTSIGLAMIAIPAVPLLVVVLGIAFRGGTE